MPYRIGIKRGQRIALAFRPLCGRSSLEHKWCAYKEQDKSRSHVSGNHQDDSDRHTYERCDKQNEQLAVIIHHGPP
jgi:hypothetical protein